MEVVKDWFKLSNSVLYFCRENRDFLEHTATVGVQRQVFLLVGSEQA